MLDYNKILHEQEFINNFCYLYDRWQDEKEYEDPQEYAKAMATLLKKYNGQPLSLVDVRMTKRPFGITFTTEDGKRWKLFQTTREMGIRHIA